MPVLPININNQSKPAGKLCPGSLVEYEHSGKPLLAYVIQEKKGKWELFNDRGRKAEMPAVRLHLLPGNPRSLPQTEKEKQESLNEILDLALKKQEEIDLATIWETFSDEAKEVSVEELSEMFFGDNEMLNHLAMRRAILDDSIYFKRKKTGFEPRDAETVKQLIHQANVETEKANERENLINSLIKKLHDPQQATPENIRFIEQLAALGKQAEESDKYAEVVEEVISKAKLKIDGKIEEKAFKLLIQLGHFSEHEILAVYRFNRPTIFSNDAVAQAQELSEISVEELAKDRKDFRDLFIVTIDGEETRDIDDGISIEETSDGYSIGIHISDVSHFVEEGSALEAEAFNRATSIYCPTFQIPMLPPLASENALSLVEGQYRLAISYVIDTDKEFNILSRNIYRSIINVDKRLSYNEVDNEICSDTPQMPEDLSKRLRLMWDAANSFEQQRIDRGAHAFDRRELVPVVDENLKVRLESGSTDHSPSRGFVGELMILANETAALFASDKGFPIFFRAQEAPDEDIFTISASLPEGPAKEYYMRSLVKRSENLTKPARHAGLGLAAYTQSTSPIRRALDLITQRQLSSYLKHGEAIYDEEKLTGLREQLETPIQEAQYIQREGNRYWLLRYIKQENIKNFNAVIVKVAGNKLIAELDQIMSLQTFYPKEGNSKSESRIGESIKLHVEQINPRRNTFILKEV